MNSDWVDTCWGELATLEYGKGLRDYKTDHKRYTVYGTNGPIGTHDKYICASSGVIIGRKGAFRGVHFSPEPFYVIDTAFWLKHNNKVDTKWAYYQLLSKNINSLDSGSAIPSTSREDFYSIPVNLPPLREQKKIAQILSFFDKKIELNQNTNKTLEFIAKAIFKSWFIDFDPVKAKSESRPTGLPNEISYLFPDSMENSKSGDIPKGWRVDFLSNHFSITKGKSYKSIELQESSNALVTLKSFQRGGGYRGDGLKSYSGKYKKDQIILPGELVIALTDVTQAAEIIGRPAIVQTNNLFENLIASLDVGIIRKNQKDSISMEYAIQLLQTPKYISHALAYTSGTTVLHLSKDLFETFLFVIPPNELLNYYSEIYKKIIKKTDLNVSYSNSLTKVRDTLLPKVISGELRIPDAEKIIEEVTI